MNSSTSSSSARAFLAWFGAGVVACELAASLLLPVSRGRHEVDELIARVDGGRAAGDVAVLSDSVSYGVLDLALDRSGIVDLTSNRVVSVAGNAFLLRRYYEHTPGAARTVLYVTAPISLESNLDSTILLGTYFTSVFTRADEIADVERQLDRPDLVEAQRAEARAVEFATHRRRGLFVSPLDRWLRTLKSRLLGDGEEPDEPTAAAARKIAKWSALEHFRPSPVTLAFLPMMAEIVHGNGGRLVLTPGPQAPGILSAWRANGYWAEYLAWMETFAAEHEGVEFLPELPMVVEDDRLFYDGIHLTPRLKRAWGERLASLARGLVDRN